MPLRFDLHPGGMPDNSSMFQHWERVLQEWSVPKGRLMARLSISVVPPGLGLFNISSPNVETLGYYRMSLRDWVFVALVGVFRLHFPSATVCAIRAPALRENERSG